MHTFPYFLIEFQSVADFIFRHIAGSRTALHIPLLCILKHFLPSPPFLNQHSWVSIPILPLVSNPGYFSFSEQAIQLAMPSNDLHSFLSIIPQKYCSILSDIDDQIRMLEICLHINIYREKFLYIYIYRNNILLIRVKKSRICENVYVENCLNWRLE